MLLLEGRIQNYAWGSVDSIPSILGVDPTGEPQAELWLGAHGLAPSDLPEQGRDLRTWLSEHPEALGQRSVEAFGPRLPFLLKVLAAAQPLSLQAHPNREQAEAGFAAENERGLSLTDPRRSFKDDWPKPEMAVALTEFSTLTGFRPAAQTAALFEGLGVAAELASVIGPLTQRSGSAALAEVFLDALSLSEERRGLVDMVVAAALRHLDSPGELGKFARTAVELDEHYPGDRGILAALLLNRLDMTPGQALHLYPGNMHAHLKGTCLEIMASSDNVLRGGLTHKHIDVDSLVQVVDFVAEVPQLVEPDCSTPGLRHYPTPSPEFDLWMVELGRHGQSEPVVLPAAEHARILLVLDGYLACASAEETTELVKGQSAFIPAGEIVRVQGDAEAVLASTGA
ncbi:mannose-6-phosphate isomerase, class I [Aestuariimicrobium sp. Y1814]|uniref:mannose-6-phosphate isomerase, class I n=1 Tax=Aestuariimicrobium sp. Y1814 TaxID=3418742 RepID=UPI003DA7325E